MILSPPNMAVAARKAVGHGKETMNDSPEPIETATRLTPRFDAAGLITAVVTDADSGEPLVIAHMNAEALVLTLETGEVHFWSRSRKTLWKKGETSGHILSVVEVRVDCDQDAIWVRARPAGPTCHTGAKSCFYRRVERNGGLVVVDE